MKVFWKKKQFWGALIAIALLVYCVKDIRLGDIRQLMERVNYYYLIPAVFSSFLFLAVKGLRWWVLISPQKKTRLFRTISLYSAGGILNISMPALTGQVGRLILFASKEKLRRTVIFSTIILEILFDAVSLVVFMAFTSLAFAFPSNYRSVSYIISAFTVVLVISLYLVMHFRCKLENTGRKHLRDRWPGTYITLKKFIRSFTKGIELLKSSQHIFASMALSLMVWGLHMFVVFFLFKSFGFSLPLAAAAVVMIVNTVVLMIPITPGNAGTFEFAVSTSLVAFSVNRSDAVLFALALHLIDLLPIFTIGMTFLFYDRASLRQIRDENEDKPVFEQISEEGELYDEEEEVKEEQV